MKLSTKGRYAVRAMLDLALHYGEGPILLKDVARREHISERYLEPPSQIRLIEVMQVSEGSMAPVECVSDPEVCSRSSLCVTRDIWSEMKEAMSGILESTTLQDLIQRQREKEQPEARMYYI
jgi:Rrf2 family cysteine metabolism transcriptional repressor